MDSFQFAKEALLDSPHGCASGAGLEVGGRMKTIIEMAREAGLIVDANQSGFDSVEAFAALVAAEEREACAQLIESLFILDDAMSEFIAKAIRARGNT